MNQSIILLPGKLFPLHLYNPYFTTEDELPRHRKKGIQSVLVSFQREISAWGWFMVISYQVTCNKLFCYRSVYRRAIIPLAQWRVLPWLSICVGYEV